MANKSATTRKVELGSAFDLLPKSWEIVKNNWQAFAVVNILSLLSAFFALFPDYQDKSDKAFTSGYPVAGLSGFELGSLLGLGFLLVIVVAAASVLLYAMLTVLQVRSSESKLPTPSALFEAANKNWLWLRLVGLAILSGLIILVGLILLIIPGIIAFGRIVMAPYFMVDKDLGVMDSLKASNALAKEHPGKVWAAIGVMILVSIGAGILNSIPSIGPLLGTLLAIAFSLVLVLRYQQLKTLKAAKAK